jgi:hypothetical protein
MPSFAPSGCPLAIGRVVASPVIRESRTEEDGMSELVPSRRGLAARESRQVSRELARLDARGQIELARISQQANLQAERVAAVGYVGKRAMHEVAMLSQLEVQLSALVPSATPRLQGIGDLTALSMADVVSETVRRVS